MEKAREDPRTFIRRETFSLVYDKQRRWLGVDESKLDACETSKTIEGENKKVPKLAKI